MVAARGDARRASFAQVGNEDGENAAAAGSLSFRRGKDGIGLLVGHRNFVDDGKELALGFVRESVHLIGNLAEQVGKGSQGSWR